MRSNPVEAGRSADLGEIAVAAEPVLEARRAGDAVFDQRFAAVVPLVDQRLAHREPVAPDGRATVGAHADLREACNLARELLGLGARPALRRDVLAQTD